MLGSALGRPARSRNRPFTEFTPD